VGKGTPTYLKHQLTQLIQFIAMRPCGQVSTLARLRWNHQEQQHQHNQQHWQRQRQRQRHLQPVCLQLSLALIPATCHSQRCCCCCCRCGCFYCCVSGALVVGVRGWVTGAAGGEFLLPAIIFIRKCVNF